MASASSGIVCARSSRHRVKVGDQYCLDVAAGPADADLKISIFQAYGRALGLQSRSAFSWLCPATSVAFVLDNLDLNQ